MKKIVSKIVLIMAVAVMLSGMSTVMASAKNVKLKNARFTTSTSEADATATVVKKGTVTASIPKAKVGFSGYMKFTAPATKTYSFTVSNVKGGRYCCGFFYIMTTRGNNGESIGQQPVATKGGTTGGLFVASKGSKYGALVSRYLKSRTGKIALQQGQTVYLHFYFSAYGTKSCSFRLNIK